MDETRIRYVIDALHDVVSALDRYEDSGDDLTDFQPVILKLDYLQRLVVRFEVDDNVMEMVRMAYQMLVEIDENKHINCSSAGYRASLNMNGQRGRPSYDIMEEQLSFLLEQGFKVLDVSNILGVSVRTVERRMSTFGLSVSGKVQCTVYVGYFHNMQNTVCLCDSDVILFIDQNLMYGTVYYIYSNKNYFHPSSLSHNNH